MIERDKFGPGQAGELAYQIIKSGVGCEAQKDGQLCGQPATQTIDMDILGNYEPFPVCGEKCASEIKDSIQEELRQQGKSTVWGSNGWGRA